MFDYDNLDVMVGGENINPIERELASAIVESSVQSDNEFIYLQGKIFP